MSVLLAVIIMATSTGPSEPPAVPAEAKTTARLTADAEGNVTGCEIVASSGRQALDEAACRVLRTKARFDSGDPRQRTLTVDWTEPAA